MLRSGNPTGPARQRTDGGQRVQLELEFPDRLGYRVRRSNRARQPSVRVCLHEGVVLTLPACFDERRLPALLREWQSWIRSQVENFEALRATLPAELRDAYPRKIGLPASGDSWKVVYQSSDSREASVRECDGSLFVRRPDGDPLKTRAAMHRWLARKARSHLQDVLDQLAAAHGFDYRRLAIRGQKTRWGSCSTTGTISLNYLLMFLAPAAANSVVLHELCHTRYMSHGPRFYALLERLEPAYRQLDEQVRDGWRSVPAWAWPG